MKNKYYIPLIGWLIAAFEYVKAVRAFRKSGGIPFSKEYDATWAAFSNTRRGLVGIALGIIPLFIFALGKAMRLW